MSTKFLASLNYLKPPLHKWRGTEKRDRKRKQEMGQMLHVLCASAPHSHPFLLSSLSSPLFLHWFFSLLFITGGGLPVQVLLLSQVFPTLWSSTVLIPESLIKYLSTSHLMVYPCSWMYAWVPYFCKTVCHSPNLSPMGKRAIMPWILALHSLM